MSRKFTTSQETRKSGVFRTVLSAAVAVLIASGVSLGFIATPASAADTTTASSSSSSAGSQSSTIATPTDTTPSTAPTATPTDNSGPAPASSNTALPVVPIAAAVAALAAPNIGSQTSGAGAGKANPPADTADEAIWLKPANGDMWPQTLIHSDATNATSVDTAEDSYATLAGRCYQVDLYANDQATLTLLMSKVLNGSGESWLGGSFQSIYAKVFCVEAGTYSTGVAVCGTPTNALTVSAVPGGIWTFEDFNSDGSVDNSVSLPVDTGYTTTQPNDGYRLYTATLTDANSNDGYYVTPLTFNWTPIDPSTVTTSSLACNAPATCVATSGFASDEGDNAPIQLVPGISFPGTGTPVATDIFQHVTGNAQGITSFVVNESDTHGYTARPDIEAWFPELVTTSNPTGYTSLTTSSEEPDGTTDAIATQLWYASRLPYGAQGGQGNPLPYAQLIATIGEDNSLDQIGLHLQTHSHGPNDPAGQDESTVASVKVGSASGPTNCGANFAETVDAATPVATISNLCTAGGTDNVAIALSNPYTVTAGHVGTAAQFRVSVDGGQTVLVGTPVLPNGQTQTITSADDTQLALAANSGSHTIVVKANSLGIIQQATINTDDVTCDIVATPVVPTPPTASTCNGTTSVLGTVETIGDLQKAQVGVIATLDANSTTDGTFTAAAGYVLKDGSPTTFSLGVAPAAKVCTNPIVLAFTNISGPSAWLFTQFGAVGSILLIAALVAAIGIPLLYIGRRRNQRTAE